MEDGLLIDWEVVELLLTVGSGVGLDSREVNHLQEGDQEYQIWEKEGVIMKRYLKEVLHQDWQWPFLRMKMKCGVEMSTQEDESDTMVRFVVSLRKDYIGLV